MALIRFPPGPKPGLFRNAETHLQRDPLGFLTELARDYGDIVHFRLGRQHAFLLNHPDHIKDVLVTSETNFAPARTSTTRALLGDGLLNSEGAFHRRQRALSQPAFHRRRIASYADVMVQHATRLRDRWQEGETVDLSREMMQVTLGIAGKTLFDAEMESDAEEVGDALRQVRVLFARPVLRHVRKLRALPFLPAARRFQRALTRLDAIIYRIIADRRRSGVDRGDLISMLLLAQEDGAAMTDVQVRDEVMTLLLAGHDTTANALAWTWYLLSQSPAVEAKLHAELDAVLGDRPATFEDFGRLVYTEMILAEALRLYPPGWRISRRVIADHALGGYTLPAGSLVFLSQYVTHRDARYYPDPSRFDPERWTAPAREARPPFAYFPFSGGTRRCLGEQFARMSGVLLLATLAGQWKLRLVPGARIEADPLFTLRPKFGMPMTRQRRRTPPVSA
ncbi:MAG: cytochrome P450 [Verrucomicrobiota bacterium]